MAKDIMENTQGMLANMAESIPDVGGYVVGNPEEGTYEPYQVLLEIHGGYMRKEKGREGEEEPTITNCFLEYT